MIISLKGQLEDWKQTRSITLEFLSELNDSDLDKKLPRKKLNTIRQQIEEMAIIQSSFVDAIITKVLNFEDTSLADTSKNGLTQKFTQLDKKLEESLETCTGNEIIDWYGEEKNIHTHVSTMIGHEQMHIGQIIAFCYATGIHIPDVLTEEMALEG